MLKGRLWSLCTSAVQEAGCQLFLEGSHCKIHHILSEVFSQSSVWYSGNCKLRQEVFIQPDINGIYSLFLSKWINLLPVIDAILLLHLLPSLSSLSTRFSRTGHDAGVLFVIYSTFKSPSTNFLTQMAQQMWSGYQRNCLSDSAAICNSYQQFSQQTENIQPKQGLIASF